MLEIAFVLIGTGLVAIVTSVLMAIGYVVDKKLFGGKRL